MKVRDVIKKIEQDGWLYQRTRGNHHIYRHPTKQGIVVVAGHPSDDVPTWTLHNILKQAGLPK